MSRKAYHEVKDPIHSFIKFDSVERQLIDSRAMQRLRNISQLSFTCLVYPGATHKRFEHSLGVMELAGRVFDVITASANLRDNVRDALDGVNLGNETEMKYWRRVVRLAGLFHDLGHPAFSHALESFFPPEYSHEHMSKRLICEEEISSICGDAAAPVKNTVIAKIAIGPKKSGEDVTFTPWERILSEIITGDAFGVDRMDYLLRDAYHSGVVHGRFDHNRLIDTLRIVVPNPQEIDTTSEPMLGIEYGGLTTVEAMLLSRYFMFSQVYFHPVSVVYNIHLEDFQKARWGNDYALPTEPDAFLKLSDNEVMAELTAKSYDSGAQGYNEAIRIVKRDHFKILYEWNPNDAEVNPNATQQIFEEACRKFGAENVRMKILPDKGRADDFPVVMRDDRVVFATAVSKVLRDLPVQQNEFVFIEQSLRRKAQNWLRQNREQVIALSV